MNEIQPTIFRNVTISIAIDPDELAMAWCRMNSDEKAEFFNWVGKLSKEWKGSLTMQLQCVLDSPKLTDEGRSVMKMIGDYS